MTTLVNNQQMQEVAPSRSSADAHGKLRDLVATSIGWSVLNNLASRLLTVLFGIVIARLLTPNEFGVYTVGLLALAAMQSMNELGVSVAIVRWPTDPSRLARTAVTLSVASSAGLLCMAWLTAPAVAASLHAPEAASVLRILAFCIVLDGTSSIPNALLTRSFLQARRTIADLISVPVSSILSIVLASGGFGGASLAWGTLVGNATATALIYIMAPGRPRPGWNHDDAKALLRFGLPLAGTSFLLLAVLNVSHVITGRILGPEALGLYMLAYNVAGWPNTLVSAAIRRVTIPAFGRLQHDHAALERGFARSLGWVTSAGLLACLLIGMLAAPLISILYGDRWVPAAEALKWLAVLGVARVMLDLCYDLLASVGRTRALLAVHVVWFAALVPALIFGAQSRGIAGAAAAHSLVALAVALPAYFAALHSTGIRAQALASVLVRPALAGCVGAAVLVAGQQVDLGRWLQVFGLGSLAGVVFVAIVVPVHDLRLAWADWRANRGSSLA
jgi:PST family polysaccharide transporter